MAYRTYIILIVTINLIQYNIYSQEIKSIEKMENITGLIYGEDQFAILGTGFVCVKPNIIITCHHVSKETNGKKYYKLFNTRNQVELELVVSDSINDIALYKARDLVNSKYSDIDSTAKINLKEKIYFCGYDYKGLENNTGRVITTKEAIIIGIGKTAENYNAEFIEFKGKVLPGYSGGPVFNAEGNIIAIISEGFIRQNLKTSQVDTMVRAFSIMPLYKLLPKIENK